MFVAIDREYRRLSSAPDNITGMRRPLSTVRAWSGPPLAMLLALMAQRPGHVLADTKLDLVVAPKRFLAATGWAWATRGSFGHVANQSIGYLFPTGPFFVALGAVGIPPWAAQRLFMASVLIASLIGAKVLASSMRIGTNASQWVGATTYAVSPAVLSTLGATTAGLLPAAAAPWIVAALTRAAGGGSLRRSTALAGLATVAAGAVNAGSLLAVFPLPVLFIITRPRGTRLRLGAWWALATGLASVWWVVPLLVQGRYGTDFPRFTEAAQVTTAVSSPFEVLRGSGYWLAHLFGGDWLPAGWTLARSGPWILLTGFLTAGGLAGLARSDLPERAFLGAATAIGVLFMAAGFSGPLGGPAAGLVRDVLDGPLAPFRNVHKFEPLVRLPLALGLSHVFAVGWRWRSRAWAKGAALITSVAVSSPLVLLPIGNGGSFVEIPDYLRAAGRFLDGQAGRGRVLVIPGAAFSAFTWGRTLDEPLQAVTKRSVASRDLIPLGSPHTARFYDAVTAILTGQRPATGLSQVLARSGVQFVVVRNDLDRRMLNVPPPNAVVDALSGSGLKQVARFGPLVKAPASSDRLGPSPSRVGAQRASLEIFSVPQFRDVFSLTPTDRAVSLTGGPEAVLQMASHNLLSDGALLAGTRAAAAVTSDATTRRDARFADVIDDKSYVLEPRETPPGSERHVDDWTQAGDARVTTTASSANGRVRASSWGGPGARRPEQQPFAAFDRDATTAWIPSQTPSAGSWIEIDFGAPRPVDRISLQLFRDSPTRAIVSRVHVRSDRGSFSRTLEPTDLSQVLRFPAHRTRRVRVTLAAVTDLGGGRAGAGLAEVNVPGPAPRRPLQVPSSLAPGSVNVILDRLGQDPFDGTRQQEEARLDRRVTVEGTQRWSLSGTATYRPIPSDGGPSGSTWRSLPQFAPRMAFDGNPDTSWIASPSDSQPTIAMDLVAATTFSSLQVRSPRGPFLRPTRIALLAAGRPPMDVVLDTKGRATFEPFAATSLVLQVLESTLNGPLAQRGLLVPPAVAASEIELRGPDGLAKADLGAPTLPPRGCGSGPIVEVGGAAIQTEPIAGPIGEDPDYVLTHRTRFRGCAPVTAGGSVDVRDVSGAPWRVESADLLVGDLPTQESSYRRASIAEWGPTSRRIVIGPGRASVLAVGETFNRGWQASAGGTRLRPVEVDGWRQGWLVPAGAGGQVLLDFAPQVWHRSGLIVGGVFVAVLIGIILSPERSAGRLRANRTSQRPYSPLPMVGVTLMVFAVGGPLALFVPVVWSLPALRRTGPALAATLYLAAALLAAIHPPAALGRGLLGPIVQAASVLALSVALLAGMSRRQRLP